MRARDGETIGSAQPGEVIELFATGLGETGTSAGLYQINITVPATLPAGTYPVIVRQNEVSSPATALLKITTGS